MSRKARLFELMVKREKLALRRKSDALNALINDHVSMQDLDSKLLKLLAENQALSGTQTVQALRSKAWYGREMAQQQEFTSNRLEFLGKEIATGRSILAQNKQKERILSEKVLDERKVSAQEVEDRADKSIISRNFGRLI